MDPLSITASATGLLTAVAGVAITLRSIVTNVKDAPREVHALLAEVDELQVAVAALNDFIQGANKLPKHRTSLISFEQLVATLTEAVLTMSEIEVLLKPFKVTNLSRNMLLRNKLRMIFKQGSIVTIIQRLQRNKASLNLMFNIVQCESDKEAAGSHIELRRLIKSMLEANYYLCRRMNAIEEGAIVRACGCSSVRTATQDQDDADTIRPSGEDHPVQEPDSPESDQFRFAFENILEASRVYRKAHPNECDMSFRSSIARSRAWSSLSDLSLAQISIISVIALPVYPSDISNSEWYTFGDMLEVNIITNNEFEPDGPLPNDESKPEEPDTTPSEEAQAPPPSNTAKSNIDTIDDSYRCKGCGEELLEGRAFEFAGHKWHIECFRCSTCATLLDADVDFLLLGDESLICSNCKYSCTACGNSIEDLAILTGDQAFCASCFSCQNCKMKIENLQYARTSQGMFCMSCHRILVARRTRKKMAKHDRTYPPPVRPRADSSLKFTPNGK